MNSVINIIDGEKCVFFSDEEMNNVNVFENEECLKQNLKPEEYIENAYSIQSAIEKYNITKELEQ